MHNWSTNEKLLQKDPEAYAIWKLEQMINFGLDGQKIPLASLKKHWGKLQIDPHRKKFLKLLLNGD